MGTSRALSNRRLDVAVWTVRGERHLASFFLWQTYSRVFLRVSTTPSCCGCLGYEQHCQIGLASGTSPCGVTVLPNSAPSNEAAKASDVDSGHRPATVQALSIPRRADAAETARGLQQAPGGPEQQCCLTRTGLLPPKTSPVQT